MPNAANVQSPLTLIAMGRSGTSLLQAVFAAHPLFEIAGETTELIFGGYLGADLSCGQMPDRIDCSGQPIPHSRRCADVARAALLAALPGRSPRWMHKPIGLPAIRPTLGPILHSLAARDPRWRDLPPPAPGLPALPMVRHPCPADWYWQVMSGVFPEGRFFTVLRHPCDVVLSAVDFWGGEQIQVWMRLAEMARVLTHKQSRIEYAVHYHRLIEDPEATLRELFENFGVPWEEQVLEAMNEVLVPGPGRGNYSRRDQWDQLDPAAAPSCAIDDLRALWKRWGATFDLPPQFKPETELISTEA